MNGSGHFQYRNRELHLLCRKVLRSLLSCTEGDALKSVYLWGSILRQDFDPVRSDVDVILVGESLSLEETCRWLSRTVIESQPALRQFKVRPLYLEDFNGEPPRSELAQLIHPRILLADFENWARARPIAFARKFWARAGLAR